MTDREMDQVLMNDQRVGEPFDCSHVASGIEFAQPRAQGMVLWEKFSVLCKPQVKVHRQVAISEIVATIPHKRFAREKYRAKS